MARVANNKSKNYLLKSRIYEKLKKTKKIIQKNDKNLPNNFDYHEEKRNHQT
jgi:hypothetical protein